MSPTPSGAASKQTVEFECDFSYEGGFGFSLAAFFPLLLGAGANFRIDVSGLKFFCHAKVTDVSDRRKLGKLWSRIQEGLKLGWE
jgi:hypothetical protein